MSVERYFCLSCGYSSAALNLELGLQCASCGGDLRFGRKPTGEAPMKLRRGTPQRSRRLQEDNPHMEAVRRLNQELMDMKLSEEDELLRRKRSMREREIVHAEAYKRKTEQAPIVIAALHGVVPEELHENERLFNGIEVPWIDPLGIPDYQEDYDVPKVDYWSDVPLSEMATPF